MSDILRRAVAVLDDGTNIASGSAFHKMMKEEVERPVSPTMPDDMIDSIVHIAEPDFVYDSAELESIRKIVRLALNASEDKKMLDWMSDHPQEASTRLHGTTKFQTAILWGISSSPDRTLREALRLAMRQIP